MDKLKRFAVPVVMSTTGYVVIEASNPADLRKKVKECNEGLYEYTGDDIIDESTSLEFFYDTAHEIEGKR